MAFKRAFGGRWFPPAAFYEEAVCTRCGVCCGATDGHPCEHLRPAGKGEFVCAIYENRLGPHATVDGRAFVCVPIRKVIEHNGGYADCAYVKKLREERERMGQDASGLGRRERP